MPNTDYVNVTVKLGLNPPLLLNGHGVSQGVPIVNFACGEFGPQVAERPVLKALYDITLAPKTDPAQRFTIKLWCTFSGGTSEFNVNKR
jgi:hypothetical protein